MVLHLVLCYVYVLLQISRRFCRGKEPMTDVPSSLVSKRTWRSSQASNSERFRTPLVVEQVVKFDTLGTTFIPRIFEAKNRAYLFGNFEDPIDELVKEFYSNAIYTGVELTCKVRGKKFSINPNYIAKVLLITRPANVDLTSYDDRQPQV